MDITFESFPKTVEEFITIRDANATTPEGGAACWALALLMYSDASLDPLIGLSCLIASVDLNSLSKSTNPKTSYKGYAISNNDLYLLSKVRVRP
jgi:hypothetical protein